MTHVLRYLLIFGDRKKKVELSVSEEVENVKVETLKQKAKELFSLKNVLLQIWDKGFEDWVDLDEGDPTPTNSRIKVEIDKEARSVADVTLAKRMPSSMTMAKPALMVSTSNAGPPVLQVLSSQSSYPPVALTTTEVSLVAATQKSLPPLARLPPHSQSVSPKPSPSGVPQRTLPVSQRQYLGEQPQGSQALGHGASSSVGKPILVGEDIQNERDTRSMTECSRGALWSVMECKYLIGIWCSDEIQLALGGITTRRNKPVYKRIALRLADIGFQLRPWDRVRDKVNRVKTEYRKIRRQLANGFREDQIAFPTWYAEIHAVYGAKLSVELPDVVDDGDHDGDRDDLSSTMQEDRDESEDRISDDEDDCSADSVLRDAGQQSGHNNRLGPSHDRDKRATKDGNVDESGGSIHDGDSGRSNGDDGTGEGDDAWIVEGISEVTENQSQDDTQDGSTDKRATRGVKRGPEASDEETSKRGSGLTKVPVDLVENNIVEGEKDGQNGKDEKSGSKGYHLREVKIEMVDHDETF